MCWLRVSSLSLSLSVSHSVSLSFSAFSLSVSAHIHVTCDSYMGYMCDSIHIGVGFSLSCVVTC